MQWSLETSYLKVLKNMPRKNFSILIDENLATTELRKAGHHVVDSGIKDTEIIDIINTSNKPIRFITRNTKDFSGKLNKEHQLITINGKLQSWAINICIPKALHYLESHTSTRKHERIGVEYTEGATNVIAEPGSRKTKMLARLDNQ